MASCRGATTSTKAVEGSANSSVTRLARLRIPVSIPSKARKKATVSRTVSAPTIFAAALSGACAAKETARRVGAAGHDQHPDGRVVEKSGQVARGAEEVHGTTGRRGVHHDEVEATLLVELVQLLDCHVLLGTGQRVAEVAVQPAAPGSPELGPRRGRNG